MTPDELGDGLGAAPGREMGQFKGCKGLFLLLLLSPLLACAQRPIETRPPPLSPAESVRAGRELVAELLAQKPETNSSITGEVRIREANDQERQVPVKFELYATPTNWVSVYQTLPAPGVAAEKLTVIHCGQAPNEYLLLRPARPGATNAGPISLAGNQTMVPFAGTDFWVADLGLEFLHWPRQRVVRKEMRHGQPCAVLESVNPHPGSSGYVRVVSWVDTDNGGILHADAYAAAGGLLKQFDPSGLKKVNGQRQLEEMEMRNRKTGSHTWIKFDLGGDR